MAGAEEHLLEADLVTVRRKVRIGLKGSRYEELLGFLGASLRGLATIAHACVLLPANFLCDELLSLAAAVLQQVLDFNESSQSL